MKAWMSPLSELAEYQALLQKIQGNKGVLMVSGCMDSQKVHMMAGISEQADHIFILTENDFRHPLQQHRRRLSSQRQPLNQHLFPPYRSRNFRLKMQWKFVRKQQLNILVQVQ